MDLKDILAISGKPGLFKNVGQSKNGVIVESLTDGKRFPAFAHERISSLAEISVFTLAEDVPLEDVFKKMFELKDGGEAIDPKSGGEKLKAFMKEVLPEYDEDRVYVSDIKKMITWYNLLVSKGMLEFPEEEEEEAENETEKQEEAGKEEKSSESDKS